MPTTDMTIISEGGNAFKDKKTGAPLTGRVNRADVLPTVKWLEGQTGLPQLSSRMLGTTGKKDTSGDLDLGVHTTDITKDALVTKLLSIPGVTKDDVKKSGNNVHLKTPIRGNPGLGFVQTDFMFGDTDWLAFYYAGAPDSSEFKGVDRHILWSSVAKPQGLKVSDIGLVDRGTNKVITADPEVVTEKLLGPGCSASRDMISVESVIAAISKRPDFETLVGQALEPGSGIREPEKLATLVASYLSKPVLSESATESRIQHPEDLVFLNGTKGAQRALNSLLALASDAHKTTTVKWDGSPAVFFGIDLRGKFVFTDKGGFTVKSYKGRAESPEELEGMLRGRKPGDALTPSYAAFAKKMSAAFEPVRLTLKASGVKPGTWFKGDILYMSKPTISPTSGEIEFKPNVVSYSVAPESDLGQQIQRSSVGVVLHTVLQEDGTGNITGEQPVGTVENLQGWFQGEVSPAGLLSRSGVLIFAPVFVGKPPKFNRAMVAAAKKIQTSIEASRSLIEAFLGEERLTALQVKDLPRIMQRYSTSKADSFSEVGTDSFLRWLASDHAVSDSKKAKVAGYVSTNKPASDALFGIVKSLEALKNTLVEQFDSDPNTPVKASIGSVSGGEGYVAAGSDGDLVKLVNRGGFTAANRQVVREGRVSASSGQKTVLGFYPGSFKPFHRGHWESCLSASQQVSKLVVVATTVDRVRPGEFPIAGKATAQYMKDYISPALRAHKIKLVLVGGSPIKYVFDEIMKLEQGGEGSTSVVLFAGAEDTDRFSTAALRKQFPRLWKQKLLKVSVLDTVGLEDQDTTTGDRLSGAATRECLRSGTLSQLKALLPPVPEVATHLRDIKSLFKSAAKSFTLTEAVWEAVIKRLVPEKP